MYGARDVHVESAPDARLIDPTDALVCVTRACICDGPAPSVRTSGSFSWTCWKVGSKPGKVFDRVVGLDEVPDGYHAMAEREAIKVIIEPR
jgi:threonine dehydrogenase-like Zn-dependent dehydrogenase